MLDDSQPVLWGPIAAIHAAGAGGCCLQRPNTIPACDLEARNGVRALALALFVIFFASAKVRHCERRLATPGKHSPSCQPRTRGVARWQRRARSV